MSTSVATVSRWASSPEACDPALTLYLTERVRNLARVKRPQRLDACKAIAAGGGKGGSGGSVVSAILAIAAADLGFRVAFCATQGSNPIFSADSRPLGVQFFEDSTLIDKSGFDFVFIDLYSTALSDRADKDWIKSIFDFHDLIVIPTQLDSIMCVKPTLAAVNFVRGFEGAPPWSLLQVGSVFDTQSMIACVESFKGFGDKFLGPALIHPGQFFSRNRFGRWQFESSDVEGLAHQILEDVALRLDIRIGSVPDENLINAATLEVLLDLIEPV